MRVVLLNPPSAVPVNRRFRCTYQAPNFLFPPLELATFAAMLKDQHEVTLLDAVAERLTPDSTVQRVADSGCDAVVYLAGFETLGGDVETAAMIRGLSRPPRVICTGYIPSLYASAVLEAGGADVVVVGEPEEVLPRILEDLEPGLADPFTLSGRHGATRQRGQVHRARVNLEDRPGVAYIDAQGEVRSTGPAPDVDDLDALPPPDYSTTGLRPYHEFLLPRPFAVLQTSRGCPFGCRYCVHPHGRRYRVRSPGKVVEDVAALVRDYGVRTVRFEDDLFTLDPERVMEICHGLRAVHTGVRWTCLARPDTLPREMVREMKRAGCARVYVGIESGSPRVLAELGRGGHPEEAAEGIAHLKEEGIEVASFFIVGLPSETEDEFRMSMDVARRLDLDYICISSAKPYPGTELYKEGLGNSEVSLKLLPFSLTYLDPAIQARARARERAFYRDFYLRPAYLLRMATRAVRSPATAWKGFSGLVRHIAGLASAPGARSVRQDLI